jgi:hypothetical protein
MKKVLATLLITVLFGNVLSQSIQTDRPSAQTESSSTVYKDAFQIEYGATTSFISDTLNSIALPNSLYRYGLFENFEIRIANDLMFNKTFNEITLNPLQIGGKLQLLKKDKMNLAFLSMLSMNNLKAESKDQFFQNIITKVIGSNQLSNKLNFAYTIGHNFKPKKEQNNFNYSLFLSSSINDKLSSFVELYGSLNYYEDPANYLSFDLGFAYLANPKLQLDFYSGLSLNDNNYFGAIGLSYLFMK